MSCPKKKQPQPGEVVSRWLAVEWGDREEQRLADLLFGRLPNRNKQGGSCQRRPAD